MKRKKTIQAKCNICTSNDILTALRNTENEEKEDIKSPSITKKGKGYSLLYHLLFSLQDL